MALTRINGTRAADLQRIARRNVVASAVQLGLVMMNADTIPAPASVASSIGSASLVDTVFLLQGTDTRTLAMDCHDIARAFVDESQYWGKPELATWLLGQYSRVVQQVRDPEPRAPISFRVIDALTIDNLIGNARAEVLHSLDRLADPETASDVAFAMVSSGFVARTVDTNGRAAWVPTSAARRLADRVLSLFVAHFLSTVFSEPVNVAA